MHSTCVQSLGSLVQQGRNGFNGRLVDNWRYHDSPQILRRLALDHPTESDQKNGLILG